MATPKPLELSTAELLLGGYRLRPSKTRGQPDEIYFRIWYALLANGDKYTFDYHRQKWRRWVIPSRESYKADHWRNASAGHDKQLDAWLHVHADYVPDTFANRYTRGVPSDAQSSIPHTVNH